MEVRIEKIQEMFNTHRRTREQRNMDEPWKYAKGKKPLTKEHILYTIPLL